MKATNLTSLGGFIRAGDYGHLSLNGPHTLESGVRFERLTVNGHVRSPGYHGRHIIVSSGHLVSDGDTVVHRVFGHGIMQLNGGLQCTALEFVGRLEISRPLNCAGHLSVHGSLSSTSMITAKTIEVHGVLNAVELQALGAIIEPFEYRLATRLNMPDYNERSRVKDIRTGTLTARQLSCTALHAYSARLREECAVEYAEYLEDFAFDESSSVRMISKAAQAIGRDRSPRLKKAEDARA
ncbi:MAG: hypothetical protein LKF99_05135 [Bifidobacterium sp.]|jgi:hypothetical protein|nr:hypothetical protein [Bifidobacterium sp.]